MKLGLFDHMQKHDHPSLSYVELYKNHLEVLECADEAGMDFYFVAEHHFDMGFSECPSPGSFLGAASQRTDLLQSIDQLLAALEGPEPAPAKQPETVQA